MKKTLLIAALCIMPLITMAQSSEISTSVVLSDSVAYDPECTSPYDLAWDMGDVSFEDLKMGIFIQIRGGISFWDENGNLLEVDWDAPYTSQFSYNWADFYSDGSLAWAGTTDYAFYCQFKKTDTYYVYQGYPRGIYYAWWDEDNGLYLIYLAPLKFNEPVAPIILHGDLSIPYGTFEDWTKNNWEMSDIPYKYLKSGVFVQVRGQFWATDGNGKNIFLDITKSAEGRSLTFSSGITPFSGTGGYGYEFDWGDWGDDWKQFGKTTVYAKTFEDKTYTSPSIENETYEFRGVAFFIYIPETKTLEAVPLIRHLDFEEEYDVDISQGFVIKYSEWWTTKKADWNGAAVWYRTVYENSQTFTRSTSKELAEEYGFKNCFAYEMDFGKFGEKLDVGFFNVATGKTYYFNGQVYSRNEWYTVHSTEAHSHLKFQWTEKDILVYDPYRQRAMMVKNGDYSAGIKYQKALQEEENAPYFTLSGTMLVTPPTEPGIYIHNGKKFYVK